MTCGPSRDNAPDAIVFNRFAEPSRALAATAGRFPTTRTKRARGRTDAALHLESASRLATVAAKDAKAVDGTARALACHGNGDEASGVFTRNCRRGRPRHPLWPAFRTSGSQVAEQFLSANGVDAQRWSTASVPGSA